MRCRIVVTVLIFLFTRERSVSVAASSVVMDEAARLLLENVVRKQVRNAKLLAREEARARFQGREEDQCPCLMCIEGGPWSYMKRRTIREHLRTWGRHDAYWGPTQGFDMDDFDNEWEEHVRSQHEVHGYNDGMTVRALTQA